jgi:hypothetical protein
MMDPERTIERLERRWAGYLGRLRHNAAGVPLQLIPCRVQAQRRPSASATRGPTRSCGRPSSSLNRTQTPAALRQYSPLTAPIQRLRPEQGKSY